MKIIKQSAPNSAGKVRVVVEVSVEETLRAVNPSAYYRLGEPLGDVVQGHVIEAAELAMWCPITQKWISE